MTTDEISKIDIELLHLDPYNPRLPERLHGADENQILTYLATTTAIEDLVSAIAENGFFPGEPLVAFSENGKIFVIEGNRRLTAVKLLQNPNLLDSPSKRLIEIVEEAKNKPQKLPVVMRENRASVLPYLGFRHITGVKQWEPLAKARYMRQLWDTTPATETPRSRYKQVASMIGSRSSHIKRSLDALAVYGIISNNDFYDLDSSDIKFSVLSTALADEPISRYIGISPRDADEEVTSTDPIIDAEHLDEDHIKNLAGWLFRRDEKGKARVAESREIRKLAHVLDNERATISFGSGSSLDYAYRLTKGSDEEFIELIYSSQSSLQQAASLVANVDYSPEAHEAAKDILNNIRLIGNTLKSARDGDTDEF